MAYSPDGTRIASGSYDGCVIVWDAATGAQVEFPGKWTLVAAVEGPADVVRTGGHVIVAGGSELQVYAKGGGQQAGEDTGGGGFSVQEPQQITSVRCWGERIGVGCNDGTVYVLRAPFLAA